jgi:hypothetical protein
MTKKKNIVHIGSIGVDTGQLIICDPCYIDSEWEKEDFKDIRIYKNSNTGNTLQYRVDFENFATPIPEYDNKTMNELISTGEWEQAYVYDVEHGFSYNACAQTTSTEKGYGELNYKHGHSGVAVALATTIGDGYFPVYGKYDEDGTLLSVTIKITEK